MAQCSHVTRLNVKCLAESDTRTATWVVGSLCTAHYYELANAYEVPGRPDLTKDLSRLHVLIQFNTPRCIDALFRFEREMQVARITSEAVYRSLAGQDPRFAKNTDGYLKYSRALEYYEGYCWFPANRALLSALLTDTAFKKATDFGFNKDTGAGPKHGEQTHRLQWHVIMREITNDFTVPFSPPWQNSPLELYWQMIHSEKNFWGNMLDSRANAGWGDPDRLLDEVRRFQADLFPAIGKAVERRLNKRSNFDTGNIDSKKPFRDSPKITLFRSIMHSRLYEDDFQRLLRQNQNLLTVIQRTSLTAEQQTPYFEETLLNEIYGMEKSGVPGRTAIFSIQHFAKLVYQEAVRRSPGLFSIPDQPSYGLHEGVAVKRNAPDVGVTIGDRRDVSKERFNRTSYAYRSDCGAYPIETNRW
jgi:hypothetical protein